VALSRRRSAGQRTTADVFGRHDRCCRLGKPLSMSAGDRAQREQRVGQKLPEVLGWTPAWPGFISDLLDEEQSLPKTRERHNSDGCRSFFRRCCQKLPTVPSPPAARPLTGSARRPRRRPPVLQRRGTADAAAGGEPGQRDTSQPSRHPDRNRPAQHRTGHHSSAARMGTTARPRDSLIIFLVRRRPAGRDLAGQAGRAGDAAAVVRPAAVAAGASGLVPLPAHPGPGTDPGKQRAEKLLETPRSSCRR
jgi:hypothetical protein